MAASSHGLEKEGELVVAQGLQLLWAHQVHDGKWQGKGNHKCHKRNGGKDGFVRLRCPEAPVKLL